MSLIRTDGDVHAGCLGVPVANAGLLRVKLRISERLPNRLAEATCGRPTSALAAKDEYLSITPQRHLTGGDANWQITHLNATTFTTAP